ncbi:hypothetical protein PC120_g28428 [Phytophthora cactorum]|nr:hypothetical protein PC120_g28428 [Phytophthora cactorum]
MDHYLGSLLPSTDQTTNQPVTSKFAQICIVDPDMQQRATRRRGIFSDICLVALGDIEAMMEEHNPLTQQFLIFGERGYVTSVSVAVTLSMSGFACMRIARGLALTTYPLYPKSVLP